MIHKVYYVYDFEYSKENVLECTYLIGNSMSVLIKSYLLYLTLISRSSQYLWSGLSNYNNFLYHKDMI